ncbi:hypothetical protein PPL_12143 [Heterostelium album PN500]|uniref:DDE Tnp4 domain-containing protein n=1 Tax=Heterostelium pallidum (strain ATCC 26659 / Pp 5 / PN500) TaxID=670386 RepID=D3BLT9_HETP5|nr:hypothetical protein PPL_12143 [Heterostelium album PN500]EFA77540.1 hypothetical protein PPL_12143 [Heterostelium album PN500]|eukprot:XP_020429668.1 hypothetical protein PPL_12143 [Heterostelium album PN500]
MVLNLNLFTSVAIRMPAKKNVCVWFQAKNYVNDEKMLNKNTIIDINFYLSTLEIYCGVSKTTFDHLYSMIKDHFQIQEKHLLWFLVYLRQYNSLDIHAVNFGVSVRTFKTWVDNCFVAFNIVLKNKLKEDVLLNPNILDNLVIKEYSFGSGDAIQTKLVNCAVDTTLLQIPKPIDGYLYKSLYCTKHKIHGYKYEAVVGLKGELLSLRGPFPGSQHDASIYSSIGNEIDHLLSPSYWMLGDKGYIGGNRIFAPNKKLSRKEPSIRNPNKTMKVKVPFTPEQKAENSFINSNRAVARASFVLGSTEIMVSPHADKVARSTQSSLIHGMAETKQALLARYIKRNGSSPSIALLYPQL